MIISAFPACGKTWLFQNLQSVSDSDSSKFSWISDGVRHPDFPNNYIQHIKSIQSDFDYITVSSHSVVTKALLDNKLDFVIVYPAIENKQEWIQRCKNRGNTDAFIKIINDNYENWIIEIEKLPVKKIKLQKGQYLSNVLDKIK